MKHLARVGTLLLIIFLYAPAAWGQDPVSVSGTVTDANDVTFDGVVEIRAWHYVEEEQLPNGEIYTGHVIVDSSTITSSGNYELELLPGTYLLDASMGVRGGAAQYPSYDGTSSTGKYWIRERWHDTNEQQYVLQDATSLLVLEGSPIEELNFRLPLGGAAQGRVRGYTASSPSSRVYLVGADVRMEHVSDYRRHHNTETRPNPSGVSGLFNGRFVTRGLIPNTRHRLMVFDREGYNATYVQPESGQILPSVGDLQNFGNIDLEHIASDPYPLNRSIETAVNIGRWNFEQEPPPVWDSGTTNPALIAPRSDGVVNYFCWQVHPEDRFFVTATTQNTLPDPDLSDRYHPWVDPIVKVVNEDEPDVTIPGTGVDRYSGPGPLDGMVDTGRISESGTYCAAVSMAGDDNFDGLGQYMAGHYVLRIEMGNRPPRLDVYHEGTENPSYVSIDEGDSILLDVEYSDPENDPLSATAELTQGGSPIPGAVFNDGPSSATWTWDSPVDGAGTYNVLFTVSDHEFTTTRTVAINVGAQNHPPTTPALQSPSHGATVTTRTPTLAVQNSEDPDGPDSELMYEIELYYEDPEEGGSPDQVLDNLPHGSAGVVYAIPNQLPEKNDIWWRARADDGADENRYSDWTGFRRFFVHSMPPEIEAYLDGEQVDFAIQAYEGDLLVLDLTYRAPYGPVPDLTFSLENAEGEEVEPKPELEILDSGIEGEGEAAFTWQIGPLDSLGSPYPLVFTASDNLFSTDLELEIEVLPHNLPPSAPEIIEPEDGAEVETRQPTIIAANAVDPEGEEVFLHFEIAEDPDFETIVQETAAEGILQDEDQGTTAWALESPLEWDVTYFVRVRATDVHGLAGAYSAPHSFYVLPRTAPVIIEPQEGELIETREPVIVAENAQDPEGIPLSLQFEVASDDTFSDIVAGTHSEGVPQDYESGETSWEVDETLVFGEVYFVRARAVDDEGLVGPYSDSVSFEIRDNRAPSESTLAGPFEAECSGGVFTDSPLEVPIVHGTDPDGDPVQLHIQVYEHGSDFDPEGVGIEMYEPANPDGDITVVQINIGSLPDNERYTIRVRSYDGTDYSSWHTCDFWSNVRNNPPAPLTILSPEPGSVFPLNTEEVVVEVQNVDDPDLVVPGTYLEIAWCASLDPDFGDCPADVAEWEAVPQSSLDTQDTTEFGVRDLTNREAWYIKACARDETGLCGPSDETWVVLDQDDTDAATTGCCSTSPGGHPWLALFALLCLALMAPRPRRSP